MNIYFVIGILIIFVIFIGLIKFKMKDINSVLMGAAINKFQKTIVQYIDSKGGEVEISMLVEFFCKLNNESIKEDKNKIIFLEKHLAELENKGVILVKDGKVIKQA